MWPVDDMDRHLELAIAQMEKVQARYEDEPEFASAVAEEIIVLKSRLSNNQDGPTVPQPTSWGNFWS
jgi:hypothetical protein